MRPKTVGLVYQHKVTGEKIMLTKITPGMWYRIDESGKRIHYKTKDLENYKFLKNESNTGGWRVHTSLFLK